MTCIVALEHAGAAWIGCDSFMGDAHQRDRVDRPKFYVRNGMAIGFAGSIRAAQLVEHGLRFRPHQVSESVQRYLVTEVARKIRIVLNREGAAVREQGTDSHEAEFVVCLRGEVWTIQQDYAVLRSAHGYTASGSGAPFALGALAATPKLEPHRRIMAALKAAATFSTAVCDPFHVEAVR